MHACALGLDLLGLVGVRGVGRLGRGREVPGRDVQQANADAMRCAALRCARGPGGGRDGRGGADSLYLPLCNTDTYLPSSTPPGCFITHYLPTYNGTYIT
jgi:hypothetical protein